MFLPILLAIVALILVPLVPRLLKLRIRVLRWLNWQWAVRVHEKYFDGLVIGVRIALLVGAAILLFVAGVARAESHEDVVERAFDAMADDIRSGWAFTQTTTNSDGVFVATFDPEREDQWQLLTVDDREPTKQEREEFLAGKERDEDGGDDEDNSMVEEGSLELLEETASYWLFRFRPKADDEEGGKFMESVVATLKVSKEGPYVAEISMRNTDTIKPGKGVKIKTFRSNLVFAPENTGGPALPRRVDVEIEGRAFLVAGIDEQELIEFSDYRRRSGRP